MATQSLLANGGLRSRVLGSSASLAFAFPIADGNPDMAAHTAANRTGFFAVTTLGSESLSAVVGGQVAASWSHNGGGSDLAWTGRLLQTGVAYTVLPAGVEVSDVVFNEAQIKQFATSAPATQRSIVIQAPTYSCNTPGATITNSATLAISGSPIAGTNLTLGTSNYALWIQSGESNFDSGSALPALRLTSVASSTTLAVVDAGANGSNIKLAGAGASKTIRNSSTGNFEVINGAYTQILTALTDLGNYTQTQQAAASSIATAFTLTGAANTGQTSGTEAIDVNFALNRNVSWATSTPATQRAFLIRIPTYLCDTPGATITSAATFAVAGAPAAGTNVAITSSYAGTFGGAVLIGGLPTSVNSTVLSLAPSAASSGTPGVLNLTGAANTLMTSATEVNDVNFNLGQTKQWATTTPTTQRAILITAPTYSCNTAAQTITSAATMAITNSPTAGTNVTITNAYALWVQGGVSLFAAQVRMAGSSSFVITQQASATNVVTMVSWTGAAHTALTSGVECIDVNVNLARTVQWTTTTPATQRAFLIQAPTYSCDTAAQTITTAATLAITNSPQPGTNVTITNPLALWVQGGNVLFAGTTSASSATVGAFVVGNGTAATSVAIGAGSINAGTSGTFGTTLATTNGAITAKVTAGSTATVVLDSGSAGVNVGMQFNDNGVSKWQLDKGPANGLNVIDTVNTVTQLNFSPGTVGVGFINSALTLDATDSTHAAFVLAGGLAVGKSIQVGTTGTFGGNVNANGPGGVQIVQGVLGGGTRAALSITAAANLSIVASSEASLVLNVAGVTRQWATSPPSTQREWQMNAATYACDTAAQTITTSATLAIVGAPIAGTNVTLTSAYALLVQTSANGGKVLFQDTTSASSATVGAFVVGNGTAATSVAIGGGQINAGSSISCASIGTVTGGITSGASFAAYPAATTVGFIRGNSGSFAANSMVFQSGGTTTAGGGFYFGVNNGTSTSTVMQLTATGFGIFGTTPAAQSTGYGTPTGGAKQSSFAAGSITLPNLAAAVAQLILDLKAFGYLGA